MRWAGKVIGGLVGLAAGPVGAAVGVILGHSVDVAGESRGAAAVETGNFQTFFFDTVFAVMGFVAKSDGRVSESEIASARSVMSALRLDGVHVERAIASFSRGKQPDYPVDETIRRLTQVCAGRHDLLGFFLEIQMRAALGGDGLEGGRRRLILEIGRRLGFADAQIGALESMLRQQHTAGTGGARTDRMSDAQARTVLGVGASAGDGEIKKAYRRLMSENHPDKLVARGLPESMQELAKQKTQRIREAYEALTAARARR